MFNWNFYNWLYADHNTMYVLVCMLNFCIMYNFQGYMLTMAFYSHVERSYMSVSFH